MGLPSGLYLPLMLIEIPYGDCSSRYERHSLTMMSIGLRIYRQKPRANTSLSFIADKRADAITVCITAGQRRPVYTMYRTCTRNMYTKVCVIVQANGKTLSFSWHRFMVSYCVRAIKMREHIVKPLSVCPSVCQSHVHSSKTVSKQVSKFINIVAYSNGTFHKSWPKLKT